MATTTKLTNYGSKLLSDKERIFVDQYLIDLDIRKAALRSGYAAKSAASTGHAIINRPHVRRAIGKALAEMQAETRLSIDEILDQLHSILTRSAHQFVNMEDGTALGLHELDEKAAACVDGFDQEIHDWVDANGEKHRTIKNKIKLVGKAGAIDMAMKYRGLFERDNEQKQTNVTLDFSTLLAPPNALDPVVTAIEHLEETAQKKLTIEVPTTKKKGK